MKKLVYLTVMIVALGLIVAGCIPTVPHSEQNETSSLMKANSTISIVVLSVEPPTGTSVEVGESFDLEVWARFSVEGHSWNFADIVFQWDPTYLQLDGGTSFPGHQINATWDDGDAAIAYGGGLFTEDICMVTLNFTALASTSSTTFNIVRNATAFPSNPSTMVIEPYTWKDLSGTYYGADIEIVPPPIEVEIDIKPGSDPNSINLESRGMVPVAVLTTDDFDASTVDPITVEFAGASPVRWTMEDVDDDGDLDMLFHFKTQDSDLNEDSINATLTGETYDRNSVQGTDRVNIVPKNKV